jgi:hypothetical protein
VDDMRNAYKILVGKPEGKRPLGRPRWTPGLCQPLVNMGSMKSGGFLDKLIDCQLFKEESTS